MNRQTDTQKELYLDPGRVITLAHPGPCLLTARSPLWITWPGSGDHLLSPGQTLAVPAGAGPVVAEGLPARKESRRARIIA